EKGVQSGPDGGAMLSVQAEGGVGDDRVSLSGGGRQAQLPNPNSNYDNHLTVARAAVAQDPKRVAQVVKNWVGTDA
ncbi:MAG: flagellar basal-body MS-ring/collar protein FliF, partial [Gammaproteobacteria bacterium]